MKPDFVKAAAIYQVDPELVEELYAEMGEPVCDPQDSRFENSCLENAVLYAATKENELLAEQYALAFLRRNRNLNPGELNTVQMRDMIDALPAGRGPHVYGLVSAHITKWCREVCLPEIDAKVDGNGSIDSYMSDEDCDTLHALFSERYDELAKLAAAELRMTANAVLPVAPSWLNDEEPEAFLWVDQDALTEEQLAEYKTYMTGIVELENADAALEMRRNGLRRLWQAENVQFDFQSLSGDKARAGYDAGRDALMQWSDERRLPGASAPGGASDWAAGGPAL